MLKYIIEHDNQIIEFTSEELAQNYLDSNNIESTIETVEENIETNYPLRITELLHYNNRNLTPSKINFRKHLSDNTQLKNKDVVMNNGRPEYAIYTLNNVNIARIRFEFEFDSIGFCSRRKEILGYYNTNDEILEEYIISDEEYSNTEYHLGKKMEEAILTRRNVLKTIMTVTNMVLLQNYLPLGQTVSQVQAMASQMFKTYNNDINVWIETGDGELNQLIENDTTYSWLELEVSTGVTIRQFITSKID